MKYRSAITSLIAIIVFCGYLMTACNNQPLGETEKPGAEQTLLSAKADSSRTDILSLPVIVDTPKAPVAPATVPVPTPVAPDKPVEAKRNYREVWAIVTAYCPCSRCCGRHSNGRTSTGTSAWRKGVAADPTAIPYGTVVFVEGYGMAKVDDTGGAMRQSFRRKGMIHLDLRMTYHYQARRWGRRTMKVRIYD